jgi:acyl-CoA thioesterase-2
MLDLDELDRNLYRACHVFSDGYTLYGGQVAAQALRAAGLTVAADRQAHSLHGYFLRPGDSSRPTIFKVYRDRDGRSFSARRVVAIQNGDVIFNMSASFAVPQQGPDEQVHPLPDADDPDSLPVYRFPRLLGMTGRLTRQPYGAVQGPTRFWARSTVSLGDDELLHACVLTYLSDISSGLFPFESSRAGSGASIDHAVWFHRSVRMDDWVQVDLQPQSVARGRGWYTGTVHARSGELAASLTQEALFRDVPPH